MHLTADLSAEMLQARREWQDIFKVLKGKNLQPRLLYPARISLKIEGKLKSFLEKEMATHSSVLAWRIPGAAEPGGLPSMGLHRVGHDRETSLSLFLSCTGEGNGNPLQCSCLENPRDGGAWWAAIYGVTESDMTEAT